MPSRYRQQPEYQWYERGDANGMRPAAMPAFNIDNASQNRVIFGAGELYCRFSNDDGVTLCRDRHRWSSMGALKKHVRDAHEVAVAESHPGGLKAKDDLAMIEYWANIYKLSHGTAAEVATPRKAKAVAKDNDLFEIPTNTGSDGSVIPDFVRMKANMGIQPNEPCSACAT
ncbi:hypothetical protein F4802DRAFT_611349 [Xylaria palmicola]|nr:hypothetical protein F4802DRAFT_611349 [Xylaria palmicola]